MVESFAHPTIEANATAELSLKIEKKLQLFSGAAHQI